MKNPIIPRNAWLTVNRACNFRCPWCYAQGTKYASDNDMTEELAKKLVDILISIGIDDITMIGGEPTLWPHLLEINKYISDKDIKSGIVTNAFRFSDDVFWERYLKHPNDNVGISVKAWSPESHRDIVSLKKHNKFVVALQRALTNTHCGVSFVINKSCVDHLVDMVKFMVECGVKLVAMNPCVPVLEKGFTDASWVVPHDEIVQKVIDAYPEMDRISSGNLGFEMMLPLCIWPKDFIDTLTKKGQIGMSCQIHFRSGVVFNHLGHVSICNGLFDYPVGQYGSDFSDGKTLLDLLNSKKVTDTYDQITSYPSKKCFECPKWKECGGGCPMFWTHFDPDLVIKGWNC